MDWQCETEAVRFNSVLRGEQRNQSRPGAGRSLEAENRLIVRDSLVRFWQLERAVARSALPAFTLRLLLDLSAYP